MPNAPKFCNTCRYATVNGGAASDVENYGCLHPKNLLETISLVTGRQLRKVERCSSLRNDESLCGTSGAWYTEIWKFNPNILEVPAPTKKKGITLDDL